MPMYEYRCRTGHTFDDLRPMHQADAPAPCPDCGAPAGRMLSLIASVSKSNRGGVATMMPDTGPSAGGGCCGGSCGCN